MSSKIYVQITVLSSTNQIYISTANPNFIIGFDLVGQEDRGKPLHHFIAELADLPKSAKYFFHAGETSEFTFSN